MYGFWTSKRVWKPKFGSSEFQTSSVFRHLDFGHSLYFHIKLRDLIALQQTELHILINLQVVSLRIVGLIQQVYGIRLKLWPQWHLNCNFWPFWTLWMLYLYRSTPKIEWHGCMYLIEFPFSLEYRLSEIRTATYQLSLLSSDLAKLISS